MPDAASCGPDPCAGVISVGGGESASMTPGSGAGSAPGAVGIAAIKSSPLPFGESEPPASVTTGGSVTGGDATGGEAGCPASLSADDVGSSSEASSSTGGTVSSTGGAATPTGGAIASTDGAAASTDAGVSSPEGTVASMGATAASAGGAAAMAELAAASVESRCASRSPKPDASATDGPCGVAGRAGAIMERMACADMVPRGVAGAMVTGALAAPDIQRPQRKSRASSSDGIKLRKTRSFFTKLH